MKRTHERTARLILIFILIALPLGLLGARFLIGPNLSDTRTIRILAAAPEEGGFEPDTIRIAAGESVRLVFHSPDVLHGFAIGPGLGLDLGDLAAGETLDYTLRIDQPGRYTLYCTVWCSPNHWRMRMVIEVYDPDTPNALATTPHVDETLLNISEQGMNIDEAHAAVITPLNQPSATRGGRLYEQYAALLPDEFMDTEWLRWQRPDEVASMLIASEMPENDAWDIVAYLWTATFSTEDYEIAARLYAQNCAACHGDSGNGDGPGAVYIEAQNFHGDASPTAFTDAENMLGGNSATYYAKLRRGGMGTSMPGFGAIFSQEETWLLADFIWIFAFDE